MSKLINCKDCGKEVSKNAKTCPNCGAKVKKGGRFFLKILLGFFLFFVLLGIIANLTETENGSSVNKTGKTDIKTEKKSNLELLDWSISKGEFGNPTIIGKVKNNRNKEYSYVQITFNLYDASDALVGTAVANVNNLEPGEIWKFQALCLEDNFKKGKYIDLTGF